MRVESIFSRPTDTPDVFDEKGLQLLLVHAADIPPDATLERAALGFFPGLFSRSAVLPLIAEYRDLYDAATDRAVLKVGSAGEHNAVVSVDREAATIRYTHRDSEAVGDVPETCYVRLLRVSLPGEGPGVIPLTSLRAQVLQQIETSTEITGAQRMSLLRLASYGGVSIAEVAVEFAQARHTYAREQIADKYDLACARAAYAMLKEMHGVVTSEGGAAVELRPAWDKLPAERRHDLVLRAHAVLCGKSNEGLYGGAVLLAFSFLTSQEPAVLKEREEMTAAAKRFLGRR